MSPTYRKQEQEPASVEITEVASNILRLQLPISMPGLGHVNCYALVDKDGYALVDPGLPGPDSWDALSNRLKDAELPLERLHTVVVTHSHVDHFGGADQLQEETGAEILTHKSWQANLAHSLEDELDIDLDLSEDEIIEAWKDRIRAQGPNAWGTERGMPPDESIREWMVMGSNGGRRFRAPNPTVRVADGQTVQLAGREWFSMHTPGHTTDHLCLWDPEEGVLLTGDHVLPTITPHIAGSTEIDDPLAAFFASLQRVSALEGLTVALPAHGHPFSDVASRADYICHHHGERLDVLREAADDLLDGDVEAYMKVLFRERAWGTMAESETYAHLEHLRVIGEATSHRDEAGLLRYRITPSESPEPRSS